MLLPTYKHTREHNPSDVPPEPGASTASMFYSRGNGVKNDWRDRPSLAPWVSPIFNGCKTLDKPQFPTI